MLIHDKRKCNYCGICHSRCPHKAIKVDSGKKTWKLRLICMKCGRCVRECPQEALKLEKKRERIKEQNQNSFYN